MINLHSDPVRTNPDIRVGEDLLQSSTKQTPSCLEGVVGVGVLLVVVIIADIRVGEDLLQSSTKQTPSSLEGVVGVGVLLVVVISRNGHSTKQSAQIEFNCKVKFW